MIRWTHQSRQCDKRVVILPEQGIVSKPASITSGKVSKIAIPIHVAGLTITFIKSRHETAGCLDAFEVTIPTSVHLVIPHFHRHYDETIFGVDGITTWTIDGVTTELHPGDQLFVPRGSHHTYANLHPNSARIICLATPGVLGPEYFQELSYAMDEDGPMDFAAIALVMSRYGVIPASIETPASPVLPMQEFFRHSHGSLRAD